MGDDCRHGPDPRVLLATEHKTDRDWGAASRDRSLNRRRKYMATTINGQTINEAPQQANQLSLGTNFEEGAVLLIVYTLLLYDNYVLARRHSFFPLFTVCFPQTKRERLFRQEKSTRASATVVSRVHRKRDSLEVSISSRGKSLIQ